MRAARDRMFRNCMKDEGRVYTSPPYRGRGSASPIFAALSQRMLDSGNWLCFLFTDLANPTANGIYQKIGYKPVCDYEIDSLL